MDFIDIMKSIGVDYGIFAALFVALLMYVIKTNDKREKRYEDLLDNVHARLLDETLAGNEKIQKVYDNVDVLDAKVQQVNQRVDDVGKKVEEIDRKVDILAIRITDKSD